MSRSRSRPGMPAGCVLPLPLLMVVAVVHGAPANDFPDTTVPVADPSQPDFMGPVLATDRASVEAVATTPAAVGRRRLAK